MRVFASDVEDKAWYNDRDFWRAYLSMLASQRFNRFNLAFDSGTTLPANSATPTFILPILPAAGARLQRARFRPSDAEREQNLRCCDSSPTKPPSADCTSNSHLDPRVSMDRQPRVNHTIEGLTPQTHATYCRDALKASCRPVLCGRRHFPHPRRKRRGRGSYDFWKTVFDGVAHCGRQVEIDMHAKGIDQSMIDVAWRQECR